MIDYNKPWGWVQPARKASNNVMAPLAASQEQAAGPIQGQPDMMDQIQQKVGMAMAGEAAKSMGAAYDKASAVNSLPVGQVIDATGGMETAVDAAGNMSSVSGYAGPIGAAVGGAMKGEYDEAAGAALGATLGATYGPIGSMIGAKLGGWAGNAVGGVMGFEKGTTAAKQPDPKSILQSVWESMSNKGKDAVAVSTGNSGALGQAKKAMMTRKEMLDAEEQKAVKGYANGTPSVGGKGMTTSSPTSVLNRPFGATSPTGYYGELRQGASPNTMWRPTSFATTAQQQAAAAGGVAGATVPTNIWFDPNPGPGGVDGGPGANGGVGATDGAAAAAAAASAAAEGDGPGSGVGGAGGVGGGGGGGGK